MYEVEFHEEADAEMRAAAAYYEQQVSGLGIEFLDEVDEGLRKIREFPSLWPVYEGKYRRHLLKRFAYGLIYRVEPERIYIMAVAHLRRRPGYWKKRLKSSG